MIPSSLKSPIFSYLLFGCFDFSFLNISANSFADFIVFFSIYLCGINWDANKSKNNNNNSVIENGFDITKNVCFIYCYF